MNTAAPVIGIIMGSDSDWPTMQAAAEILTQFAVPFEARVVSAHRTPDAMFAYAEQAAARGLRAIIAGAGGAAHLPGMVAAKTTLPVLGVPVQSRALSGQDSLLSIVQMPRGVPVATFAIGEAGAANAALFAVAMLAGQDETLARKLADFRRAQADKVRAMTLPPAV
ncbi:MAG: 5-(carboxyamino)imidazole ribonucleotide mutase [Rhodocyclaceae bacterium]|nr:5-(carboxyamino)imidazole ribonucleotide mutase [Rhodocyclaceae bacterium]